MGGKRLITESDVRAMARGADLVLAPDTIATPAALDLAFERGVRVVRSSEAKGSTGSGCSCGGSCSKCGAWGKLLASDGTYVVVVKNGVASITRLTEHGPAPLPT